MLASFIWRIKKNASILKPRHRLSRYVNGCVEIESRDAQSLLVAVAVAVAVVAVAATAAVAVVVVVVVSAMVVSIFCFVAHVKLLDQRLYIYLIYL